MDFDAFLKNLKRDREYRGQLVYMGKIPPRKAVYGELNEPLHPLLCQYLKNVGIRRLYSHQASGINKVLQGAHVAVVTSTASGKTLCYNLPILHSQLNAPGTNALYLFPTKALAQDQMRKLREFHLPEGPRFGIYDGDTPTAERRRIRRDCHTVLTNPDMLHVGILPSHMHWFDFFSNLGFIVIDEMHTYRGVFGAHLGNVIRRLRRICRHYGSVPQFITCSATIGNPEELMLRLTGVRAEVLEDDGSPSGEKSLAFWNPPYIVEGERRSANMEAAALFVRLVSEGVRNITFTRARVVAELIYRYAQEQLKDCPQIAGRIMSYRGGYTPEQRREIERGLFDGTLLGVTATNALELGVDIGGLDACVLTGYPGTISSTWQQAGRAGRGGTSSLAILVALDNPLDQFLMRNPGYLLNGRNEFTIIDPTNPYVLAEHLMCAAYELPLTERDVPLFGKSSVGILNLMEESGNIVCRGGRYLSPAASSPAGEVNIRTAGGSGFEVYVGERMLGTVEDVSAFRVLHEGAVYLHLGESYVVEKLDIEGRLAHVDRRDVDYYTAPRTSTETRIKSEWESRPQGQGTIHFGEVRVTSQVIGYWKKQLMTDINMETNDLDLPARTFETTAVWFTFDKPVATHVLSRRLGLEGGLHGMEHALIGMLPLYAMCDRNDIGGVCHPLHPDTAVPVVFVYDALPGGVGISETAYKNAGQLVQAVTEAVEQCRCPEGCPSCIQSPKCGSNNYPLDKASALSLLRCLQD